MNQSLVSAGAVVLPGIGLGIEVTVLQEHLAVVANAHAVVVTRSAVVVVIHVDVSEADAWHALFAEGAIPVVMHRDPKLTGIL